MPSSNDAVAYLWSRSGVSVCAHSRRLFTFSGSTVAFVRKNASAGRDFLSRLGLIPPAFVRSDHERAHFRMPIEALSEKAPVRAVCALAAVPRRHQGNRFFVADFMADSRKPVDAADHDTLETSPSAARVDRDSGIPRIRQTSAPAAAVSAGCKLLLSRACRVNQTSRRPSIQILPEHVPEGSRDTAESDPNAPGANRVGHRSQLASRAFDSSGTGTGTR